MDISSLSTDDLKRIGDLLNDPCKWAEAILRNPDEYDGNVYQPLKLNYVERLILSSKHRRNVIRVHRRSGKCVAGDEKLTLHNGSRVLASDLIGKSFKLLTLTESGIKPVDAFAEFNDIEETYKLISESGREVVRNAEHPFYVAAITSTRGKPIITPSGWVSLKDIKPDDLVAVPEITPYTCDKNIPIEHVKLLAYLIGDGGFTATGVIFTQEDNKQLKEFKECVELVGGRTTCSGLNEPRSNCAFGTGLSAYSKYSYGVRGPKGKYGGCIGQTNPVTNLLRQYGLMRTHSRDKHIPDIIFQLSKESKSIFLSRLFSTDGWACICHSGNRYKTEIGFSSCSIQLAKDVQELLLHLGICSRLLKKKPKCNGKEFTAYSVFINKALDVVRFCETIGIYGKEEAIHGVYKLAKSRVESWTSSWRHDKAPEFMRWERVKSIESAGIKTTVAISVPTYHTFLTTFYEHNTFSLCIRALWRVTTKAHSQVLIICPSQSQVDVLFDLLLEFLRVSPGLDGSIESSQKRPSVIKFSNGSIIRGFTTGAMSKREAKNIRSQTADEIMVDEAAFLNDSEEGGDWAAITPIMRGDATRQPISWVASTPTQDRGTYYRWCMEDQSEWDEGERWHRIHVSLEDNPDYPEERKLQIKNEETEDNYLQEWAARFPDVGHGVFRPSYVERAKRSYSYYREVDPIVPGIRTMGVDWDKYQAGPNIIILEMDPEKSCYKVVYHEEIAQNEYTLTNAVDRIIKLDSIFNCNFIYVDRGFGEMQIETLHKYGVENKFSHLDEKVVGVSFSECIVVKDPATGQDIRKLIKPVMVNILVKWFEDNKFIYSKDHSKFEKQLLDFKVVGKTALGLRYTDINEHIIDATLLASYAMFLHFADPFKFQASTKVYVLPVPQYVDPGDETPPDDRNYFKVLRDHAPGRGFTSRSLPRIEYLGRSKF